MSAVARADRLWAHLLHCAETGVTGPEIFLRWVEAEMDGLQVDWTVLTMAVSHAVDLKHAFYMPEGEAK